MHRPLRIVPTLVALSVAGQCSAGLASASPPDGSGGGSCSFILTPPTVVQVSTTAMVLATVKPGPCTLVAIPNRSVVCLSIAGSDAASQCGDKAGPEPAVIYYPYRPGATYVVTGRGCVDSFEYPANLTTGPVQTTCQPIGPTSFTL